MSRRRPQKHYSAKGIALLMVVSFIAMLALILIDFSKNAHTHLSAGVNIRDDVRATTLADTALVMSRACLDSKAWGPMGGLMSKVDMERLCDMLLGIFLKGRVDLPIGGLSVELEGVEGIGLGKGELEEVKLTAEEAFISIAALHCDNNQVDCGSRRTAVSKLRSLLCDPEISPVFEKEQADGHRYTRAEVIGNLIDWIDIDDNRIYIDPSNWHMAQGTGEGEDSYLRALEHRYRSKDAPFDSIEELRLVRGIDDRLFAYLKDKVTVHSVAQVNVNDASTEVIASLLQSHSAGFQAVEMSACGQESDTMLQVQDIFRRYSQMIVDVRQIKASLPQYALSKPYKTAAQFIADARDPMAALSKYFGANVLSMGQQFDPNTVLMKYGLTYPFYQTLLSGNGLGIDWGGLQRSVGTENNIFRLTVKARVGNITRTLFAILKRDGQTIRTLYYRED
ncbi:general secretion pathway protein GspK [Myxococcota bacterium]|nr:general secretion pathway protein GspK [Myxococcota bacterium]MBU1429462.1 general secretion pathway protein GspK [Myxococcota bacterium]MBU1897481.1 general secretion pathway protein GspK [Myxococcota bacterium]